jgi:hypothetical protein
MIYSIPTSPTAAAGSGNGKKKGCSCGGGAQQAQGPLVLNGQSSGPILPMGNNLFQLPTRRRRTTTTPQGKNLFTQTSQPAAGAAPAAHRRTSRRPGLQGLGQADSLDVLPVDTSNLSTISSVVPDYISAPDISSLDTTLNPFLTPALDTGALTTQDVSSVISPDVVSSYAAQTGLNTTQALQAIEQAAGATAGLIRSSNLPAVGASPTPSSWLSQQSLMGGVSNWVWLAAGGGLLFVLAMGKKRR